MSSLGCNLPATIETAFHVLWNFSKVYPGDVECFWSLCHFRIALMVLRFFFSLKAVSLLMAEDLREFPLQSLVAFLKLIHSCCHSLWSSPAPHSTTLYPRNSRCALASWSLALSAPPKEQQVPLGPLALRSGNSPVSTDKQGLSVCFPSLWFFPLLPVAQCLENYSHALSCFLSCLWLRSSSCHSVTDRREHPYIYLHQK